MEGTNRIYDLSGEYELCLDEKAERFENPPGEYPMKMTLPGTTAQQGIGIYNTARETGFLTEKYPFEGQIWLRRKLMLTKEQVAMPHCFLYLERTRMTRVWLNGELLGEEKSLCTPHVYELSGRLRQENELVICVKNMDYPTRGGHMTSPDTQTNWIGITGEMFLELHERQYVSDLCAFPDAAESRVTVCGTLFGANSCESHVRLYWEQELPSGSAVQDAEDAAEITGGMANAGAIGSDQGKERETCRKEERMLLQTDGNETFIFTMDLPEDAPRWSEFDPSCITLEIVLPNGEKDGVRFGLRDFKACGDHFEVNGTPIMLRGKHDGMVFPLTGAAPTDVSSWEKVFRTMKAWGINHHRFHTCCPPEAAFTAADNVGIYLEPELPFWGTIDAPDGEKYNGPEQAYLIREGLRICRAFGNHPSFCMLSLGNELWGNPEHIGSILEALRSADPRPLYTQGSNNFQFAPVQLPEEDFWTGVRTGIGRLIRGSYADCDKPLGRIQTQAPSASWNYEEYLAHNWQEASDAERMETAGEEANDGEIEIQYGTGVKKVKASAQGDLFYPTIPIVTHEVGQYNVYPDYREIEGYTGVLEARNFEIFRERLEKAGMADQAEQFFRCSGAFSRDLYKMEVEAAMRSPHLAGFQLLDLQDFPGQGTALVGMLNARLENKGFVQPKEWRAFCGDLVPLALFDSYVWERGAKVKIGLALRSGRQTVKAQTARITYACGTQTQEHTVEIPEGASGYLTLGSWEITPGQEGKAKLCFEIPEEGIGNSWEITVFPRENEVIKKTGENVFVARKMEEAVPVLQKGGRVLLLPGKLDAERSIPGFYCTDFWNYHMFNGISLTMGRQVPVGTMGLCMDEEHPISKAMYGAAYSTPQWYMPVTHCDCAILDGMPAGYRPIVQMIDNVDRHHRLGIVYEAKVQGGSLLVCTVRFDEAPEDLCMNRLYQALLAYAGSEGFAPKTQANPEQLGLLE